MSDYIRFSKLNHNQRIEFLESQNVLDQQTRQHLVSGGLNFEEAENLVENMVGLYHLPFSIVPNFVLGSATYCLPLVTEETSVVAALAKTSSWIADCGGSINTQNVSSLNLGQIQIPQVKDATLLAHGLETYKNSWIQQVNKSVAASLVKRGGGVKALNLRLLDRPDGDQMAVIQVSVDTQNAMGANKINQICEYIKPLVEDYLGEKVGICIVSNLSDKNLVSAKIKLKVDHEVGEKIKEASLFSQLDPYRACTHNKGIMNGMDALLLATGNDFRAVEAGCHAYCCGKGGYRPLSLWDYDGETLTGTLEAPISVGVVGGMTALHPLCKFSLKLLKNPSATRLAALVAAAGLTQNLGALRALVTEGITQGHMKLHIQNLILASDANSDESFKLGCYLQNVLEKKNYVSSQDVQSYLKKMRTEDEKRV